MSSKRGFTLIELLVVVAIISLLSSIVFASLNVAREKGRDAKRMSDIEEIHTAIELYITYNNHPPYLNNTFTTASDTNADGAWTELQTELLPYIPKLSKDPIGGTNKYGSPLSYKYFTPAATGTADYGIYALGLESKNSNFGFGSFSSF